MSREKKPKFLEDVKIPFSGPARIIYLTGYQDGIKWCQENSDLVFHSPKHPAKKARKK